MTTPIVPPLKKCTKCGEEKPESLEFFGKQTKGRNGLHSWCRSCTIAASRAHYAKTAEHQREAKRQYRAENPEKVREASQKNYEKFRAERLEAKKRYVAENPEKLREHWRRMHKMRYYAEGSHTKEQEIALHDEQEGRCGYCGITLHGDWVPDHMMPIARGGSDYIENIMICCPDCNNKKHKFTIEEWKAVRGW